MLRLTHNQTVVGALLIDDIDDGLPNKQGYRLGGRTGDPKAYTRDGYANAVKQSCYVPYNRQAYGFSAVQGYIDVDQTPRVIMSSGKGKISLFQSAGLITVTSLTASQVAAPVIQVASTGASNVSITGTTFTSIAPDVTSVTFAQGTGVTAPSPLTLTTAQIVTAGGSVSGTQLTIPVSAFTTAPVTGNTATVIANEQDSNTFTFGAAPTITAAAHGASPFVITGTNLASTSPDTDTVTFVQHTGSTAPSPATFTQATILGGGGSITPTSISIPVALFTVQAPVLNNQVTVTVNAQNSNTFTIT